MSVWTAIPIARPPQSACTISSPRTIAVVVAALAAVLLGLERPSKPSSPMRLKTQSSKVVSSHSSAWGRSSLITNARIDSRSCSCSSVKMKCRRFVA